LFELLGNVDTIQEFSIVLVSDLADLRNLGAGEGEVLVVDSVEDDLILQLWAHLAGATWEHIDLLDLLSTQEVLDFKGLSVLRNGDVDGEMGMHHSHFVSESLKS
jgi:hypothetical protein